MDKVLNDHATKSFEVNKDINQNVDNEAESWSMYNESNNDLLNEFLFGDTLENNTEIINNQIDNILDNFKMD